MTLCLYTHRCRASARDTGSLAAAESATSLADVALAETLDDHRVDLFTVKEGRTYGNGTHRARGSRKACWGSGG
jgi:hypothetical protein